MSRVWVGAYGPEKVEVAVKVLPLELVANPKLAARFTREAAALARMDNPHVVKILGYGIGLGGLPYIIMELLEGQTLEQRCAEQGRLGSNQIALVLEQLGNALDQAHALGIVHRDIKPANIIAQGVGSELSVKLVDFGVAKYETADGLAISSTSDRMGTPYYMSPEQLVSAKHVDHRSDLWSLGVVAYRALMGRLPFEARSFAELVLAVARQPFVRPSEALGESVLPFDVWFARALCREPEGRFGSASEMAAAFAAAARAAAR